MALTGPTTNHDEIKRWAERHGVLPAERMPTRVDGEPATLQFVMACAGKMRGDALELSWDEFFKRFDLLGLALVYDEKSGQNELLQIDAKSPYRVRASWDRA